MFVMRALTLINPSQMAWIAKAHKGKVVVVQGQFNHVSFISSKDVVELRVMGMLIPPRPAKLFTLVLKALGSGIVKVPVIPVLEEIDLNEMTDDISTPGVIYPCKASGLS